MDKRRSRAAAALVALVIGTVACGGGASTTATGPVESAPPITAQDPPVTLRLGVSDPRGRQSEPAALKFVERVSALSNGNITIEPAFEAGDGTNAGFETSVDEKVKRGDIEFAITGTRSWDLAGVTSLRALQAPFLIDTEALALAVAKSDIATRAMDGMAGAGVSGLALWPEDLRHLYSFPHCGKDFRTPAGIAGTTILIIPSQVSRDVITALGGIDYPNDNRGDDAQACRLHGMEAGSKGIGLPLATAVSTGNVVLFPKYQVLVANSDALARLSEGQRAIIRQAAHETQVDAYARQPNEAELAMKWCDGGGTVQLATDAQIDALVAATAPVTASLEQDPLTKQLIADITALKSSVAAPTFDTACGPPPAPQESIPPQDLTGFLATAIPDGVYRTEITEADLVAKGASALFASRNSGVKAWTFSGDTFALDFGDNGSTPCTGTYDIVEGKHLKFTGCEINGAEFVWRSQGGGIVIRQITGSDWSLTDVKDVTAFFDRVWSRID